MPPDLRPFWRRAEEPDPIVGADDVMPWPPGMLDDLVRLGLLRETEPATDVICFDCGHHHGADVIYLNQDLFGRTRPHIVCPAEGLMPVAAERLRQWKADRRALAKIIAAALETMGQVEEIVASRVWSLGRRHLAGRFRDFFLLIGARHADGHDLLLKADRISRVSSPVILVPGKRPGHEHWRKLSMPLFCLEELATLSDGRLQLDLAYMEDSFASATVSARAKPVRSLPIPEGIEWKDLSLEVGDATLVAAVGGKRSETSLEECGFTRGHGDGDMALQVLRLFAHRRGTFSKKDMPTSAENKTPLKKQISVLRQKLKAVFPIDGEPILFEKTSGRYLCVFQLFLDSDPGFPTGESWLDLRIEDVSGGRIRVGLRSQEVFSAVGQTREDGPARELAVRETRLWREYPLDRLGFASAAGKPTAEGLTLLAFLRGGGRLERRPDDMPLLRLGQRLRQLSGIRDDPFRYSDRKGIWVASFECGVTRRS